MSKLFLLTIILVLSESPVEAIIVVEPNPSNTKIVKPSMQDINKIYNAAIGGDWITDSATNGFGWPSGSSMTFETLFTANCTLSTATFQIRAD